MQNAIKPSLTLFATGLFLWLLWGFWSLGLAVSVFFTVLALALCGATIFWRYQQTVSQPASEQSLIKKLPAEDYQGAVVLVCGQSQAFFSVEQPYRETSQGWYIGVQSPNELVILIEALQEQAPAQLNQLSLLLAVLPEQLTRQEALTESLLNWRRAIGEAQQKAGKTLPFWVTLTLSPFEKSTDVTETQAMDLPWFTLTQHQREFHVCQEGRIAMPFSAWLKEHPQDTHALQMAIGFDQLLDWLQHQFLPQLTVPQAGAPACTPSMWGIQWIAVEQQPNNLWQQFLHHKTALWQRHSNSVNEVLPLPDMLLSRLHHDTNLLRSERIMGLIGLLCGVFLIGALYGSYHHNRQLIRHTGEDIARFIQLPDAPLAPKMVAYQQLQQDAEQLANWARKGVPTEYSLALYQGNPILPVLHTILSSWAPPEPIAPPPPIVVPETPKTVSLDSLALFDAGQSALKPGATKVLVKALMAIRAQPGTLIEISGYTDNTGSESLNQTLSLKRAESVRDWMISTSDIPSTCFAVQGYGQHQPVASNETPEGRARNRRVEIRLLPQANACQVADNQTVSPTEGDTSSLKKEK